MSIVGNFPTFQQIEMYFEAVQLAYIVGLEMLSLATRATPTHDWRKRVKPPATAFCQLYLCSIFHVSFVPSNDLYQPMIFYKVANIYVPVNIVLITSLCSCTRSGCCFCLRLRLPIFQHKELEPLDGIRRCGRHFLNAGCGTCAEDENAVHLLCRCLNKAVSGAEMKFELDQHES